MMSNLAPSDRTGAYTRPTSEFRHTISSNPEHPYPPALGRYRLYVGFSCPWAHRTLVVRTLKGLEDCISLEIAVPSPDRGVWLLEKPGSNCLTLLQLYQLANRGYQGRSTVPVLWDSQTKTIVNNESIEIIKQLNSEFNDFAKNPTLDLYPEELRDRVDSWYEKIYHAINNGVYRCGFAQTQAAYDRSVEELFSMLDLLDLELATKRYLCGDRLTLVDVCLFTTLLRFDGVYYSLFKCDRQRIQDYPYLSGYLRDIYQLPGVAETCRLEDIKRDYYGNLFPLNPGGIIPTTSGIDHLREPHDRVFLK